MSFDWRKLFEIHSRRCLTSKEFEDAGTAALAIVPPLGLHQVERHSLEAFVYAVTDHDIHRASALYFNRNLGELIDRIQVAKER